jgi:hypothetical protein
LTIFKKIHAHIGHNFNFGLTTNDKAKEKEQTMKLTQDSNTFPQAWDIESQHSQAAFPTSGVQVLWNPEFLAQKFK